MSRILLLKFCFLRALKLPYRGEGTGNKVFPAAKPSTYWDRYPLILKTVGLQMAPDSIRKLM